MKKTDRKISKKEAAIAVLTGGLTAFVRRELQELVIAEGLQALMRMLEEDRAALCGRAYERGRRMSAKRAGSATGELSMGGRRVQVRRPRARDENGEVQLPTWEEFKNQDPLCERALEQMMIGVSTRKYDRSLEGIGEAAKSRGTSRSAVSRRFKAMTEAQLGELMSRDLHDLDLGVMMLDGIRIAERVLVIAIGITFEGTKHVLGLWDGATENKVVCRALLADLIERGVDPAKEYLFVIDGSKALRSAICDAFGERGHVQRCQFHKLRNVLGHLPESMQHTVRNQMREAYAMATASEAKQKLEALRSRLKEDHPSAAASLKEGLAETLTVKAYGLSAPLERTLSTTNLIENLNGGIRDLTRRVKRWRNGSMIRRWVGAAVVEREASFRRVRGYKSLPKLKRELRPS
ncbi:MAG: IS256 family transposase, partial [Myxococcota bacterium]